MYDRLARRDAVGHHVEEAAHADAEEEKDGRQDNLQLNTNPSKSFSLTVNQGRKDIICGSLQDLVIPGHTNNHALQLRDLLVRD